MTTRLRSTRTDVFLCAVELKLKPSGDVANRKSADHVLEEEIDPGQVFDLTLPLAQVAEGYRAMDERRAIKVLLRP